MTTKILVGLLVLAIAFAVIVATRPAEFIVTRHIAVSAPPVEAFRQVNDFHRWQLWSPWAKRDPAMTERFEGPRAGAGAIYRWEGNSEVGAGQMTILESRAPELIRIKLDFLQPFASTSTTQFEFQPSGEQTVVTWSMQGRNNFLAKAFGLFVDMDRMVGGDFEQGLTQMKTLLETPSR